MTLIPMLSEDVASDRLLGVFGDGRIGRWGLHEPLLQDVRCEIGFGGPVSQAVDGGNAGVFVGGVQGEGEDFQAGSDHCRG